jgi:SET domain-containing protein
VHHVEVEVRPSAIAGRGLFAVTAIAAGTEVLRPDAPVHEQGLLNHACDPNLGWAGDALVTLRDVAADEELVVDYALSVADPSWFLRCHCPSQRCRQMVEGDDWQILQLQRRYAGHWAPDVQALIDRGAAQPG